jgi:hypothetical protein
MMNMNVKRMERKATATVAELLPIGLQSAIDHAALLHDERGLPK